MTPVDRVVGDPALLRNLAVLATGREPSADDAARTKASIDSGELAMPAYVDSLLQRTEFADDVAPLAVLRHLLSQDALVTPGILVLKHTSDADPIYYLGDPCRPQDVVRVHPWWSLDAEVRVCANSYRPTVWTARKGVADEEEKSCLSPVVVYLGGDLGGCGCGPNLFRCYTSDDQITEAAVSLRDELRRTVAHIAASNLPAETIFTTNETFRDSRAEQVRRVQIIEARRDADPEAYLRELAAWPAGGKWAPREELARGHQAGILTSSKIAFDAPDRRQRMAVIYDAVWCVEADSVGATPELLLSIKGGDLEIKSEGWRELASRPICTSCHARLDYGMQFFFGFPHAYTTPFFVPELQQRGRGPLYAQNIEDPRGEAELNPHGFAELALAQPEFRHCMARNFVEYAFGSAVQPEQIAAVEAGIRPRTTTLKDLMRVSLLALASDWSQRAHRSGAPAPAAERAPSETVAVPPAMHELLSTYCLDCHDATTDRPDLAMQVLPRKIAVSALAEVAFGRMPKKHPLPLAQREQLLEAFIAATWTGAEAETARESFLGRMRGSPAFRPEVILSMVHQTASTAKTPSWRMIENAVHADHHQVTPGLIGITGLAAIEACRAAKRTDMERCLSETVKLDNLAIDRR